MNTFIWIALIVGAVIIISLVLQIISLIILVLIEIPRSIIMAILAERRAKRVREEMAALRRKIETQRAVEKQLEEEKIAKQNSNLAYTMGAEERSVKISKSEARRINIQKKANVKTKVKNSK